MIIVGINEVENIKIEGKKTTKTKVNSLRRSQNCQPFR